MPNLNPPSDGDYPSPTKGKSKSSPSKAAKAAASRLAREAKAREREALKAAKQRAAAEKKRFLEVNRLRTSKSDTMRELIVDLDRTLFASGQPFAGCQESVTARFQEEGASVNMCDGVVAPPLVRFRRKVRAQWDKERRHWVPLDKEEVRREPMVIVYIDAKEVVQLVGEGAGLESWYGDLKRRLQAMDGEDPQVFLICQGLVKYYARLKANENRAYTARIRQQLADNQPADEPTTSTARRKAPPPTTTTTVPPQATVERSLLQLKLVHRCYVIHAASLVDGIEWLHQLTSDLSLKPYKSLRDTHLSFAVDMGRNTTSSSSAAVYGMMLQQIPRVTPAIAGSITTIYPSLNALLSAYGRCADEAEERGLLSGVQVQSNKDGTERRGNRTNLGLQLSKRIHAVVRGRNAELLVSNPTKD
uniref:ERCC4 domain-containing protein n=2 Tax=Kalmanozyma brasiliensis (strain GHG001) TaxID=1365824 RepID=V5ED95_KALBG